MRNTLVLILSSSAFFILGMLFNKYCGWYISDVPPSWDSAFNFVAIVIALITITNQISSSEKAEIESTINVLFLDIDSIKFKPHNTNGPDALRSYSHENNHILEEEINVVDSLSSILIQFDGLLSRFKNRSNNALKLRAYTFFYGKI